MSTAWTSTSAIGKCHACRARVLLRGPTSLVSNCTRILQAHIMAAIDNFHEQILAHPPAPSLSHLSRKRTFPDDKSSWTTTHRLMINRSYASSRILDISPWTTEVESHRGSTRSEIMSPTGRGGLVLLGKCPRALIGCRRWRRISGQRKKLSHHE